MLRIENDVLVAETSTLTARIERGFLSSLTARQGRRDLIQPFDTRAGSALQLVYGSGEVVDLADGKPPAISHYKISDHCVEIRFHGMDADGVITVRECLQTGDLLVEPSAHSSRPGVLACRWRLPGIAGDLELVAPIFQGCRLPLEDAMIRGTFWEWPIGWEAGLAILQGAEGGFWVHAEDDRFRYKALKIGGDAGERCLAFDTQAYGPIDGNLAAGGLPWRLNVHQGDWAVPAGRYKSWLWKAFGLEARSRQRPQWVQDIGLAMSWCHGDPDLLDALAAKVEPRKVLLHYSHWRTDEYDVNYPTFEPTAQARTFIAKGKAMGFHILPHCNSIDMDPVHPSYQRLRDFQYRDVRTKRLLGWAWKEGKTLKVPNSNASLLENRDCKVMVKIHPGFSPWRSILAESIGKALDELEIREVFVDVTLCCFNIHNCLVENLTPAEGMMKLIDGVASLRGGTAVAGEGRNELTAQGLSLAQAHLLVTHCRVRPDPLRFRSCALNAFLFEGLARTFGYSMLSARTEDDVNRSKVNMLLGSIPTFTGLSPQEILQPNPHVQELLDRASG